MASLKRSAANQQLCSQPGMTTGLDNQEPGDIARLSALRVKVCRDVSVLDGPLQETPNGENIVLLQHTFGWGGERSCPWDQMYKTPHQRDLYRFCLLERTISAAKVLIQSSMFLCKCIANIFTIFTMLQWQTWKYFLGYNTTKVGNWFFMVFNFRFFQINIWSVFVFSSQSQYFMKLLLDAFTTSDLYEFV